jgi:hypothetical protein
VNYYTHRGLGRELLPAPVSAPVNAPFWGHTVCFLSGVFGEAVNHQKNKNIDKAKDQQKEKLFGFSQSKPIPRTDKLRVIQFRNWVAIN